MYFYEYKILLVVMDLVSIPKHVKAPSSMPNDVNLIKELMSYLEGKGFVGVQL